MRRAVPFALSALLSSSSFATPTGSTVRPGSDAVAAVAAALPADSRALGAAQARSLLLSPAWRAIDPEIVAASDVDVQVRRFGAKVVVRATPRIDGIPVEGADRLLVVNGRAVRAELKGALQKRGAFVLTPERATAVAAARVPGHLFTDPTVERLGGFARRVWLAYPDGVRAAYRVRVPTLSVRDLSDVWVDAETGEVLRTERVARFQAADAGPGDAGEAGDADAGVTADEGAADGGAADGGEIGDAGEAADAGSTSDAGASEEDAGPPPAAPTAARVFVYSPAAGGVNEGDLVDVELPALRAAHPGGYLRGDYVETFNCCKEYVCEGGAAECDVSEQRCATPDDADPLTSQLALEIPGELLPPPLNGLDRLYAKTVFCAELPRIRSDESGWSAAPVDQRRDQNELAGFATEEDAFAEVQVYYTTMQYFAHLREVLDDPSFCLGGDSMECDETGAPVLDDSGAPLRPFHITVNFLIPEIDINSIGGQILQGKGQSAGNPIEVNDFQRIDNAAFIPALEGGPIEVPPELAPLLDVFNRPYDSNVYFQGARDFAYDGDIVAHEFTHAVVHAFVPGLRSLYRDEWGASADPGAMNEGWSDYFSASFTDDSQTGEYGAAGITGGELGLRDADNEKRCPDDLTGEVHDDSEPWSGALWDIREAVIKDDPADVAALDRALLSALAEADDDETMARQAARVIDAVGAALGDSMRGIAEQAFEAHNLTACERVFPLSTVDDSGEVTQRSKDLLYVHGPDEVDLENAAPAPMQLRIDVPPGATGFSLRWRQGAGGVAGITGQQSEPEALRVLVLEDDAPFTWAYEGASGRVAQPYDADGQPIAFDVDDPQIAAVIGSGDANGVSNGSFDVTFESDPCAARTFFAQLVSAEGAAQVRDLEVELTTSDETCEEPGADAGPGTTDPPAGCGCHASEGDADTTDPTLLFGALGLAGALWARRRRR